MWNALNTGLSLTYCNWTIWWHLNMEMMFSRRCELTYMYMYIEQIDHLYEHSQLSCSWEKNKRSVLHRIRYKSKYKMLVCCRYWKQSPTFRAYTSPSNEFLYVSYVFLWQNSYTRNIKLTFYINSTPTLYILIRFSSLACLIVVPPPWPVPQE